ncbi:RNA 2',3'-cyclic phosphodiesterase [Patescibacteria group bacterium]
MATDNKKRLFIALNLPLIVKEHIKEVQDYLSSRTGGIGWVNPQSMHLTLHFLGNLTDLEERQVIQIMQEFKGKFEVFKFNIGRINAFPNSHNPRVIFLSCEQNNSNSVYTFQKILTKELAHIGIKTDTRPWRPHITLGRVKSKENAQLDFNLSIEKKTKFNINSVELMESKLKPDGAVYKEVISVKLT